ncbi:hypothetical protein [Maribacter sp. 2210JD10-5]|uniref:hypothetical protein n=1 Tax=Maribacter sp. 2210JD10-5 TaxID=3386272 RepID=UPI0039BD237A
MIKAKFWSFLILIGLIVSCNFTEEIFLEEDGSGKISINFDGSQLMDMAGEEMMKSSEKAIDSTVSFKQFLEDKKDSIATLSPEEQAKLKKLEPFTLHMVMNPEEKVMKFDMYNDFKNINEIGDAFNSFQSISSLNPQGGNTPKIMGDNEQASEVDYNFQNNTFTRKAIITDMELHKQMTDSLQSAEMFLAGSTYTLKYHFPKRVKSASVHGAMFSADGKTLIYEVGFLELMKNPEVLNLEVELED